MKIKSRHKKNWIKTDKIKIKFISLFFWYSWIKKIKEIKKPIITNGCLVNENKKINIEIKIIFLFEGLVCVI